jgi:DNA-binding NarL/FixJ family response regulator
MKAVLIDDHQIFRVGIKQMLTTASEWTIVGEAGRAREAFALIDAERPDVALVDIALPGMDGVVATREIRRRAPSTRILILTVHEEIRDVLDAFSAGAAGYTLKTEEPETLITALDTIMRGERYVAPSLAARLEAYQSEPQPSDVLSVLSEREREIFRLAAECLITREIAHELCISRKTVDTHLYRIHHKLGLRTSAELVRLAGRLGLIHSGRAGNVRRLPPPPPPADDVGAVDVPIEIGAPLPTEPLPDDTLARSAGGR